MRGNYGKTSASRIPRPKKQKVRLRGTKHANEATAKKLKKDLTKLLDNPNAHLPEMLWKGKMRWGGRTDPVTKTLKELDKIISKNMTLSGYQKE